MRVLAVWAVLFAAYAATLGVDAVGTGDFAATSRATCWRRSRSSPTATSTSRDEFATRAYAGFHPATLRPEGGSCSGAGSSRRASASRC